MSQGPAPHLSFLLASATQTFLFPFSDFSPLLSLNDDQFHHLNIPGDTYVHKKVHVHTKIHYNFVNVKKSDTQQRSKKTLYKKKDLLIGCKIYIEKNRVCNYVKTKCCIYKFSHFLIFKPQF